jgi:hypothetical protein
MSDADTRGPQVEPAEDLYRALPVRDWWDLSVDPPRIRSFAFKVSSPFSVNVASIIGLEGAIHHMQEVLQRPEGGIVSFNCGMARSHGYDARHEQNPQYSENRAHANVYFDGSKSSRKRAAKKLAECCNVAHRPSF